MLAAFSYVWLLLLVICCWHGMARPERDRPRVPCDASHSHEDGSHSHSHEDESYSHSHEDSSRSEEDSTSKEKGSTCEDSKKNRAETDIDCGGVDCPKCAATKICKVDCDCVSGICRNKRCQEQSTRGTTAAPVTTKEPTTTVVTTTEPTTTAETTTELITTVATVIVAAPSICDFECKNNGTCTDRNQCTCISGFSGPTCEVQSVGLCLDRETFGTKPILLITFGNGSAQYSTAEPERFNFSTTYKQRFGPETNDGMFSFINSVHNDFNDAWHTSATDHSEGDNGYMYLVNADKRPGQFYNGRVDHLCVGLRYEFSVYLANLCKPGRRINPNVLFEVRSVNDVLLAQLESGDVVENSELTWNKYGFSFVASSSSVHLLMISNARGGSGNDLVIDDIALRVCATSGSGFCPSN